MFKDMKNRINVHTKSDFNKVKHKITSADRGPCQVKNCDWTGQYVC